jgi:hypothetical protein
MEAFQEKMEAAINSHQEEMKTIARASQEKMEASINSGRDNKRSGGGRPVVCLPTYTGHPRKTQSGD